MVSRKFKLKPILAKYMLDSSFESAHFGVLPALDVVGVLPAAIARLTSSYVTAMISRKSNL